ncbi:MAG: hypothetical protein IM598_06875 [Chitinophagaceae bacterium]|nr:hypothetical protein [Chitinophagaceae bacterium]MCA6459666.1 hypothetical protein [Chitinophagaceae bacterium]MCA6464533.1 hypothetical protein [Chitinophagaceae bacterium]
MKKNLIAIGRSRYLYDSIKYLQRHGYSFKAIVTDEAYDEYDVKSTDFEKLANDFGAGFYLLKSLKAADIKDLIYENEIKVAISANWRYTIPENFLNLFELGVLNFHLGNLPDYKGNATVNWSIINGESYINGNIHKMEPELDAGDVIAVKSIPIDEDTYVSDIIRQAEIMVPDLYLEAVNSILGNPEHCAIKGTAKGLRCFPRIPEDGRIQWNQSAQQICRLVRASSRPYSGAFAYYEDKPLIIWKARVYTYDEKFLATPGHVTMINKSAGNIIVACDNSMLEIQELEYEGIVYSPASLIKSIRTRLK